MTPDIDFLSTRVDAPIPTRVEAPLVTKVDQPVPITQTLNRAQTVPRYDYQMPVVQQVDTPPIHVTSPPEMGATRTEVVHAPEFPHPNN